MVSLYCLAEFEITSIQQGGLGLLSPRDIDDTKTLAERMIIFWKESFKSDPTSQDTSTYVRKNVEVFKVITIHDPSFSELTEFNKWRKRTF